MSGTYSEKFYLRYVEPSEYEKVMGFYADPERRTNGVYLREGAVVRSQISRKLRVGAYNEKNQLVATSGIQPLAEGREINCTARYSRDNGQRIETVIESGAATELVGVLRMGHGPNDIQIPKGIWTPILFGVPMIMAFGMVRTPNLPATDMLVANVQTQLKDTANYIRGAKSTNSPMSWEAIEPATELLEAFKNTTDNDDNIHRDKEFYRAPISDLPNVAKFLLASSKRGFMVNHLNEKVMIDFSALQLDGIMEAIVAKSWYFKNKLLHNASWSEAKRTFDAVTPADMPTLRTQTMSQRVIPTRSEDGLAATG